MDISEWDREYVIKGELADTYGGDYTYQNVFYVLTDGEPVFYKEYYGAKPSDPTEVTDTDDINYYKSLIKKS